MKKVIWILVFVFGVSSFAQQYKTELVSAIGSSDGTKVTMVFNNPIISGTSIGFIINNTTSTTFSSLSGFGTKTLVGTLINPIVYGEPVNINYKSIETLDNVIGDLQDENGDIEYFLKEMVDVSSIPFLGIEKYVSTTGSGTHDGSSEANAYSLAEMVSNLSGGTRMNVKAGDYRNAEVVISTSGSPGNPIIIEGYTSVAGDNPDIGWNYDSNRNMDATIMPLFNGGHGSDKVAIKIKRVDYINIRNIQVLNYGATSSNNGYGLYINISNNIWVENIIVENTNRCIVLYNCDNSIITNSVGLNGWLSNISIYGNNNLCYKNKSYSNLIATYDEGTDYYYSITGDYNVFRDNYAKRDGDIGHAGHGLSIDANGNETAYYNLVDSHTTVNIDRVIEYRHPNVVKNVAKGLHSYGEGVGSDKTGGITIRDDAHDNIVDGGLIDLHNVPLGEGVLFMDSAEEGIGIGSNNTIKNMVFNGGRFAIISNDTQMKSATGTGNKILNCTFKDFAFMFRTYGGASMSSCVIKNTIIENIADIKWDTGDQNGWAFDHCNFYNGFVSQGANASKVDPKLDASFVPSNSSLTVPRLVEVIYDKNGRERKDPTTIGAFEYQDSTTGSIYANAGSDQSICLGESVTLTASGGSTYSWNTGATTKSITVNPRTTTTYTVTASEGSASDSDSVQITLNSATANAGSDKTMYEGENVTLIASGGDSYLWSTGATSKSITVSPQETQNYTLTAYKNDCEDTDTVLVTVNKKDTSPPPAKADAGEDQTICLGDPIKLTANGGKTYVWSTGETIKSITVSPTRTTSYTVTATRGGVTNSDVVIVTVENCSAIAEDAPQDKFTVYPNPTTGSLNIKADNDFDSLNLKIYSMNGSIVYSDVVQTKNNVAYKTVNLSNLSKGLYIVRMFNSDYHKTLRVLLY